MTASLDRSGSGIADVRDAVADLLHDHCTGADVDRAEVDRWSAAVWSPLETAGYPYVSVPEEAGGSGGTIAEAAAVLEAAGAAAAPVPLAETGLLAGRLLASAGLVPPEGALTVASAHRAPALRDGLLTGTLRHVPWAGSATRIVFLAEGDDASFVVAVDPARVEVRPGTNVAGEPRDEVLLDRVQPDLVAQAPAGAADALVLRGALSRACLIAGACRAVLDIAVTYTGQRVQFGRPIARFPAVGSHLVEIAQHAELATTAARSAAAEVDAHGEPYLLDVATAAIVSGTAAGAVAAAAHQAVGAMGVTREFGLGRLTRRLWSWRDEWGSERTWATRLGHHLAREGADALWPTLTDPRPGSAGHPYLRVTPQPWTTPCPALPTKPVLEGP